MKNPSFPEGVVLALSAGLLASVAYTVLPGVFGLEWTVRALIAGLGLGYVLDITENTFRTPLEVSRHLRLSVVGHIPSLSSSSH